jgi:hypothetical protein
MINLLLQLLASFEVEVDQAVVTDSVLELVSDPAESVVDFPSFVEREVGQRVLVDIVPASIERAGKTFVAADTDSVAPDSEHPVFILFVVVRTFIHN